MLVNVKVIEGERTRVQAYEGVCIGRSGRGINENFTVRKISYGEGVERVFPLYSPMIDSIKIVRRGKVRRAKLYYLRARRGKKARISEVQSHHGEGRGAGGQITPLSSPWRPLCAKRGAIAILRSWIVKRPIRSRAHRAAGPCAPARPLFRPDDGGDPGRPLNRSGVCPASRAR